MHGRAILPLMVGAALAVVAAGGARAQFYDLDGAYRCITAPDVACRTATAPPQPPPPPPPPAAPTVDQAIARIQAQQASAADIGLIESQAGAKEPRAVEALAWCKLNGIGGPADPVAAYLLYDEAAKLGIATAASNKTAIFETRLTQEQRQQVLMRLQTQ